MLGVVLLGTPAFADPAAAPPPVLALTENVTPGASAHVLEVLTPDAAPTVVLDQLPMGSYGLAVDEATGRWAMTFGQLSNGDPLMIGGKAVSKPSSRNTLVLGDAASVTATTYGDPGCTSKKTACFETPTTFSADGAYVFVRSESSKAATLSRWSFGKKPKRAAVTDGKIGGLRIAPDGAHAAYLGKDGVHVIAWPAQKAKAAKVKASKKAVVAPDLMMGDAFPIGGRVYYFRREPKEQKDGFYEAYDLASKQTVSLHQAAQDFVIPRGGFLSTGPRGTVVFGDDTGFERADVIEVTGDQAAAIAHDVRQILDVSADGQYLLVTRRKDPSQGDTLANPERLVIIELATGKDVAVLDPGGDGITITAAGFTSAP